jgi:hypothetical protein
MNKAVSLTVMSFIIVNSLGASTLQTRTVAARVELPQTRLRAGQPNPPCAPQITGFSAQDVISKAGAPAIDSQKGAPINSSLFLQIPPEVKDWLGRLGVPLNGPSTCATLCVSYPKDVKAHVEACMTETGGNGRDCSSVPRDYNGGGDHQFGRFDKFTTASTEHTTVTCVDGKNWSHNRNRWFIVTATYQ